MSALRNFRGVASDSGQTWGAKEKVQMKDTINVYFALARKETKSFLLESVWVDLNFTSMAKTIVTE